MPRDGPMGDAGAAIRDRLGVYALGCQREVESMSALVAPEEVDAVGVGAWRNHQWLVIATQDGLLLGRRPRYGRARDERLRWGKLTDARTSSARLYLAFGKSADELSVLGPADEFARFLASARRQSAVDALAADPLVDAEQRPSASESTVSICDGCETEVFGQRWCPGCGVELIGAALPAPAPPPPEPGSRPVARVPPALPSQRWVLSAPESYVLRFAGLGLDERRLGAAAFKLAVIEVIARRGLRLQGASIERRWLPGWRREWMLADGPQMASIREPALVSVTGLYRDLLDRRGRVGIALDRSGDIEGVVLSDFVAHSTSWGRGHRGYLTEVAASLRDRGLLAESMTTRTAAGDRAERELDWWMEVAKGPFRRWSSDLEWASAFVLGAGAAVLLVSEARPLLARMGHVLTPLPADQGFAIMAGLGAGDDGGFLGVAADPAIDLAGLLDAVGSLGGLDVSFDIIDAGFAAGGGDGGGGGGDGGGG